MENTAKKIDVFGGKNPQEELEQTISRDLSAISDSLAPVKAFDVAGKDRLKNIIKSTRDMGKMIKEHHKDILDSIKNSLEIARNKQKSMLDPVEEVQRKAQMLLDSVVTEERQIEEQKRQEQIRIANEEAAKRREAAKVKVESILEKAKDATGKLNEIEAALEAEYTTEEEAVYLRHYHGLLTAELENGECDLSAATAEVEEPVFVPTVGAVQETKTDGVATREKVQVEVTDMKLLCAAIGRGEVPVAAVKAMVGKLNVYAKDGMKLPGCVISKSNQAVVR